MPKRSRNSETALALTKRFGSEKEFLLKVTPDMQSIVCRDVEKAYFADYPTLGDLNEGFSWNTAEQWLVIQLWDLSEFCGCKDKMTDRQVEQCADVIASNYGYLKVSEVMLFLQRFKAARYGRFYGSVDPMVITNALRSFDRERGDAIAEHEKKTAEERKRKARTEPGVTWEEYCRMKGITGRPSPLEGLKQ